MTHAKPHRRNKDGGFTLLEVLIAVAILAVSLTSLMGSQMSAMSATAYARDISAIALLAEQQLIEIEFKHRVDGWITSDQTYEGNFGDEGYDDVEWTCTVYYIELPEYSQLVDSKEGIDEASGKQKDNIMDSGEQAFAGLGMVWSIVKVAIESSIRKVDCTVKWQQGPIEDEFTVQTFWTDPGALQRLPGAGGEFTDADDNSGANEEGGSTGGSTGGGGRGGGGATLPPSMGGTSSTAPSMGGK
jgi:general secretion pathway protein I